MTIDEAISHAREVAENRDDMCDSCRQEHKQLADWLEELKAYKICNEGKFIHYKESVAYDKAIDDVLETIKEYKNHFIADNLYKEFFDEIEQLKDGEDNAPN